MSAEPAEPESTRSGEAQDAAATSACPFCGSSDVELISPWGGQLITSQLRCLACRSYFEGLRDKRAWMSS
jgi:hypothetical protein